jgi:hypothetical protein
VILVAKSLPINAINDKKPIKDELVLSPIRVMIFLRLVSGIA